MTRRILSQTLDDWFCNERLEPAHGRSADPASSEDRCGGPRRQPDRSHELRVGEAPTSLSSTRDQKNRIEIHHPRLEEGPAMPIVVVTRASRRAEKIPA